MITCKMGNEVIWFRTEKHKLQQHLNLHVFFGKICFKNLIGYQDDKEVKYSYIMLPKLSSLEEIFLKLNMSF